MNVATRRRSRPEAPRGQVTTSENPDPQWLVSTFGKDPDQDHPLKEPAVFARHETFPPRFGWLRKGFVAAEADPYVFLAPDAHLRLGVGKNMARAIRYWCHAFKLLAEVSSPSHRSAISAPTRFGDRLLGNHGWDRHLEDPASLWLLHWRLIQRPCSATAWRFAFTVFPRVEFAIEVLEAELSTFVRREFPDSRVALSSLAKDVSCIAHMYGHRVLTAKVTEETIQSPFAELALLHPRDGRHSYRFEIGSKPGLEPPLIVAACLEFAAKAAMGANTVALSRLLLDPGSPGMAFKLTEGALVSAIETVSRWESSVALSDTAGIVQLSFSDAPEAIAERLLNELYRARAGVHVA